MEKFLSESGLERVNYNIDQKIMQYAPESRTINSKPLTGDITLTASDVGAATVQQLNDAIRSSIRNNWKDGWPDIWETPVVDTGRVGLARISSQEGA